MIRRNGTKLKGTLLVVYCASATLSLRLGSPLPLVIKAVVDIFTAKPRTPVLFFSIIYLVTEAIYGTMF